MLQQTIRIGVTLEYMETRELTEMIRMTVDGGKMDWRDAYILGLKEYAVALQDEIPEEVMLEAEAGGYDDDD